MPPKQTKKKWRGDSSISSFPRTAFPPGLLLDSRVCLLPPHFSPPSLCDHSPRCPHSPLPLQPPSLAMKEESSGWGLETSLFMPGGGGRQSPQWVLVRPKSEPKGWSLKKMNVVSTQKQLSLLENFPFSSPACLSTS